MLKIIEKYFILEKSKEEKDENEISEETEYDMDDREEIGINFFIIINKDFVSKIKGKQDYHEPKEDLNIDGEENLDTKKSSNGGRIGDYKAKVHVKKNNKSQYKDEYLGKAANHKKETGTKPMENRKINTIKQRPKMKRKKPPELINHIIRIMI